MTSIPVVAGLIRNSNGEILLARRSEKAQIAPGKYHLPGGHVEDGETHEEALRREIIEELGASIVVEDSFFSASYVAHRGPSTVKFYRALLAHDSAEPTPQNHEATTCMRIHPEDAKNYLPEDDYNLEAILLGTRV